MMYFDTRLAYEQEIMNDLIEKEMHTQKRLALQKLSSVVAHFNLEVANIFSYAWFDSVEDATKLADRLNLGKIDFFAIQGNLESFKEEFLNDRDQQDY